MSSIIKKFKRYSFLKTGATSLGEIRMLRKKVVRLCAMSIVALALPAIVYAETIGVLFDPEVEQIKSAAGDVESGAGEKRIHG